MRGFQKIKTAFLLFFSGMLFLGVPHFLCAATVHVTATVPGEVIGGGGGSQGIGSVASALTGVIFSGYAYPASTVFVLRDGIEQMETTALADGSFLISLANVPEGTSLFSVGAIDAHGVISPLATLTLLLQRGLTVTVSDIYLSPTISLTPSQANEKSAISISGFTQQGEEVVLSLKGPVERIYTLHADDQGLYALTLSGASLPIGVYEVHANVVLFQERISESAYLTMAREALPSESCALPPDFSRDCRVSFLDFYMLRFWYGKTGVPSVFDLSHDGAVTMQDFSILAYFWTG